VFPTRAPRPRQPFRYFESLRPADLSAIHSVPDGIFLVRVDRAQYRWHKQKPYYDIRFAVLKPRHLTGCFMTGRLYGTPRAMWKLSWFLRDFGYDADLLGRNEIDEKVLVDLWGVVKVSEVTVHGISILNFDGQDFDCATWLHKAHSLPNDQFKREVEKELTGRESEPWEIIYFKLYKTQIPVVEQAIEQQV
jgi:hypothetical protein